MAAGDVGLMNINVVIKNADTGIGIDVAITDDNVAITLGKMNTMAHATDMGAGNSKLDGTIGLYPVGFCVISLNTQAIHQRHAFTIPDVGFCFRKAYLSFIGADELEGGTGRGHDNFCSPLRFEGGKTGLTKIDNERSGDAIGSLRENHMPALIDGTLNSSCVISATVTHHTKLFEVRSKE